MNNLLEQLEESKDYSEVNSPKSVYNQTSFQKIIDRESDTLIVVRHTDYKDIEDVISTAEMFFTVDNRPYRFSTNVSSFEDLERFEENAKRLMMRLINKN